MIRSSLRTLSGICLVSLGGLVFSSEAATLPSPQGLLFTYASQCIENCDLVGLSAGDPVTGRAYFEPSAIGPSAIVSEDALTSISFTFGNISFEQQQGAGPAYVNFAGLLDGSGRRFAEYDLTLFQTILPDLGPLAFVSGPFATDRSVLFLSGGCVPGASECQGIGRGAEFAPAELSLVPLPTSLLLIVSAIAFLGVKSTRGLRRPEV